MPTRPETGLRGLLTALPPPVLADGSGGAVFSPGLARLRGAIQKEQSEGLLLVCLGALVSMPLGYVSALILNFLLTMAATSGLGLEGPADGALLAQVLAWPLSLGAALVAPLLVLALAAWNYGRQYGQVAADLVKGPLAVVVLDDAYGREVEAAQQERWRPNLNRVELGGNLAERLNHAAHFYLQYWRLARDRREPLPVYKTDRNCWLDGLLLTACFGMVSLLFLIRIVSLYPMSLAFKRAAYDFLVGRYDAELESQYLRRLTEISPGLDSAQPASGVE